MPEKELKHPLSRTKRFILNALSGGLGLEELLGKIEINKKTENSAFPDYYGRLMLEKDINELAGQGFIRTLFETTPLGQKEVEDLIRTAMTGQTLPRPAERRVIQMPRRVIPRSIIPSTGARDLPKPPSSIPSKVEVQPKKKDEPIKDFRDLGKLKDQFKKD